MPRAVSTGRSLRDKWHRPKAKEESTRAAHVGSHLVKEVSRKPRNTERQQQQQQQWWQWWW
eukprot:1156277-Pelagomonas_calceolata.AAC.6